MSRYFFKSLKFFDINVALSSAIYVSVCIFFTPFFLLYKDNMPDFAGRKKAAYGCLLFLTDKNLIFEV